MSMDWLPLENRRLILASQSPRRQQLLKDLGLDFEVQTRPVEEVFPEDLKREHIATYLSKLKAAAFEGDLAPNHLLITADTIVWLNDTMLAKPADEEEAKSMLRQLSGHSHEVITGVTLKTTQQELSFFELTKVHFSELSEAEIEHYITRFQPFDKAGSYGIQEWIGHIGISGIEGCYFNVMGLPLHRLYRELSSFLRL